MVSVYAVLPSFFSGTTLITKEHHHVSRADIIDRQCHLTRAVLE
jgi:hypothetical protein